MMQYLVILLDDTSVSYCHCDNPHREPRPIALDDLRRGIRYAMTENLMLQFVYPDYALPQEYLDVIDTIDHHDIVPRGMKGDVVVMNAGDEFPDVEDDAVYVWRGTKKDLVTERQSLAQMLKRVARLNIVITDVETTMDSELKQYSETLSEMAVVLKEEYLSGRTPQLNILTDRMMLSKANHCNAGVENITLAPNGRFYICPSFYYSNPDDSVGSLDDGLYIKNQQLLRLDHAPICRHCDAYQCRRCVWLNRKTTLELNTPSHEQCTVAHTEREASRKLLSAIREKAVFMPEVEIKELSYNDPFEVRKEW